MRFFPSCPFFAVFLNGPMFGSCFPFHPELPDKLLFTTTKSSFLPKPPNKNAEHLTSEFDRSVDDFNLALIRFLLMSVWQHPQRPRQVLFIYCIGLHSSHIVQQVPLAMFVSLRSLPTLGELKSLWSLFSRPCPLWGFQHASYVGRSGANT